MQTNGYEKHFLVNTPSARHWRLWCMQHKQESGLCGAQDVQVHLQLRAQLHGRQLLAGG